MLINKVSVVIVMSQKIQVWETMTVLISSFSTMRAFLAKNMTIAVYKKIKNQCFICDDITRYEWDTWQRIFNNHFRKLVKKPKEHVWKSNTIFRCLGILLLSNAFFKVCLRENRVCLIYLAIYDRTIINIECWRFFFDRATSTIRQCHTVYIDTG